MQCMFDQCSLNHAITKSSSKGAPAWHTFEAIAGQHDRRYRGRNELTYILIESGSVYKQPLIIALIHVHYGT